MDGISGQKACTKCKESLEINNFYKNVRSKDGYSNNCKPCQSAYSKGYREKKKIQKKASQDNDITKDEVDPTQSVIVD